jgi:hypothetical protein
MDTKTYREKIHIKSAGMLSGEVEGEWKVGDNAAPVPWTSAIIKAWLDDDEIQQLQIVSTNIGFVKTLTKRFRKSA